jgi:serine O-acetyltransferase
MFQHLKEDISCAFDRDPAARHWVDVMTTYPGIHAVLYYRLCHWLWLHHLKWLSRFISMLSRWLTGIEIHPAATIGQRFFIDHGMGVVIGETAVVGNDCTLYHGVTLGGTSWNKGKRHPTLGNNVVVGAGAKVLGPITIGDNSRIGSNAVVVKDLDQNVTAVGVPAHVIKMPTEDEQRRNEVAKKIGFDAYGSGKNMPDPVSQAINCMLDHIQAMDAKMKTMSDEMKKMGAIDDGVILPDLHPCEVAMADTRDIKKESSKPE